MITIFSKTSIKIKIIFIKIKIFKMKKMQKYKEINLI